MASLVSVAGLYCVPKRLFRGWRPLPVDFAGTPRCEPLPEKQKAPGDGGCSPHHQAPRAFPQVGSVTSIPSLAPSVSACQLDLRAGANIGGAPMVRRADR